MFSETIREMLGALQFSPAAESGRVAEVAAAWLATYWLHSLLLLGGAWLAGRALGHRRLAVQETLWRAALVGGLITATLQVGLGWRPLAGGWSLPAPATAVASGTAVAPAPPVAPAQAAAPAVPAAAFGSIDPAAEAIPSPPAHAAGAAGTAVTMLPPWQAVEPADPDGVAAVPPAGEAAPARPAAAAWSPPRWAVPAAVALWLAGALLLAARLALAHLRLGRRLRGRVAIDRGPLAALVARLAAGAGVGRRIGLSRTAAIPVPIARGVARGEICLPERALAELPAREQEVMVAHELAHLVRRDPAWLLAARLLESVFFLQPLHAVARRRLRDLAEYRCDDWAAEATGRPLSLARCLTEVAGWALARPRTALPAPTMAGGGSALGRRVRRLLDRPGDDGPGPRWLPLAVAAAVVAVAAVAPGVTGPAPAAGQEPEDEAAAIERAIEEDFARQQREAEESEAGRRADSAADADGDVDHDAHADYDHDADLDSDSDDDADDHSDADDRADEAGDAVIEAFEEEMESFEEEMERALEPIDEEFERHMDEFEEVFEREMEVFEEEFERHFEDEFEAMEDDFEALGEAMMLGAGVEGGIDPELAARMAELGTRIGEQAAVLAGSFSGIAAETAAVVGERLGEDFGRRAGELAAAASPDPELMARLGPELERLQAEARRLAAEERLTEAEAERLHAEARALARELRPSDEELAAIRESARRLAEDLAPVQEDLTRLAEEHRRAAERWREEHGDEMRRLLEELARERDRLHTEVERLHREHGAELERHRAERERHRAEMERERELEREQRQREQEQRELEREQREREREQRRREVEDEGGSGR